MAGDGERRHGRFGNVAKVVAWIIGIAITLPTAYLAFQEIRDRRELPPLFESGAFGTARIRTAPMHLGNDPESQEIEYYGGEHTLSFDAPNVDPNQTAVLTFEVAGVRAPRFMELNGTVLPGEPEVLNAGYDTWDTIFIVVDELILESAANKLHIVSLDEDGGTTGDVDDYRLRNIALLYKQQ